MKLREKSFLFYCYQQSFRNISFHGNHFSSVFFFFLATFEEELTGLSDDISNFHQELTRVINEMSSEHDEEKIRLSHLKDSYANKVKRLGIYEAERMAAMKNKYGYITSKV